MSYLLNGAPNARDLGGIPTTDGRRIKAQKIIRSGKLSKIDDADVECLKAMRLKTVIDLRNEQEQAEKPDRAIEGVRYISCPVLEGKAEGITREKPETDDEVAVRTIKMARRLMKQGSDGREKMRFLYTMLMNDPHAIEYYGKFFDILLSQDEGAVLFHCMMGKDRAGMAAALLLFALGVSEEDVIRDYLVTAERCAPSTARLIENCRRYTDDEAELRFIYDLDIVDLSYIRAGLDEIESAHGGMDSFLKNELRLDDTKRERLKEMYLE